MGKKIVIGTRGSMLALWQAEWVKALLIKHHPGTEVELMKIKTTGDKILDVPLAMVGGKGLFTKELEEAMLRGETDLAVHSMKDVPSELPEGLHLAAVLKREDPRDALVSRSYKSVDDLPQGARVGTSSLRRSCQLKSRRPDLVIETLRGNLDTRMRKAEEGEFDAVVLAVAGIKRLGWEDRITEIIAPDVMLPAVAQGAVGIECRADDEFINALVAPLKDEQTEIQVAAERACLRRLEGGCQVPIAAHATLSNGRIRLEALVGNVDGTIIIRKEQEAAVKDAEALGLKVAEELLSAGADSILAEIYGNQ